MRCQILINFKVISLMAFFCIYVKFTYGACQLLIQVHYY